MKKISILVILLINSICLNAQNNSAYNDLYQQYSRMLQTGYYNPAEFQKALGNSFNETKKNIENSNNSLNRQFADYSLKNAEQKASMNNHEDAIIAFNSSINYSPSFEAYNGKGCSEYTLGQYKNALDSFNKALELNSENQTIIQNKENAQKQLLKVESAPVSIYDIKVANIDSEGKILTDYDQIIYSNNTMYLKPKIFYKSSTSGKSTLQVKLFKPDGSLSTSGSSPDGYSFNSEIITNGSGAKALTAYGSKAKGNWEAGKYRLEIWHDNACLASRNFYIFNENYKTNPSYQATIPISFPSQNDGNTGALKLKQKTCSYCNGSGVNPTATSVPGYGSTAQHWCNVCNSMVSATHGGHRQCIVCKGKGYIESY